MESPLAVVTVFVVSLLAILVAVILDPDNKRWF